MNKETIRILAATFLALLIASVILVTLIFPAEFDIDPLGTGEMLGIKGISSSATKTVIVEDQGPLQDSVRYVLQPFESIEYKYRMDKDSSMLFSWYATGIVTSEFHGEPDNGPEGFAETYSRGKLQQEKGTFIAPSTGIHGWYWENRSNDVVTVTLTTFGFYSATLEFRDGFVNEHPL